MSATTLPAAMFSRSGPITAEEAAYGSRFAVWVLHPQGGSVLVSDHRNEDVAEAIARDLNGVLAAWARFTADPT